uniref:Suf domain-containing protein n=1 Tax=Heterorhabditis bacteriophora TaxID=37862 RepID=A0A1I7XTK8_HETBA
MAKAYDFALDKVGLDMNAFSIYADYISFLKTNGKSSILSIHLCLFRPAVGQYAENQRISAVRKIYQRGVATPMLNIETLWQDYCNYEKSINPTLAEKLIAERNKEYQVQLLAVITLQ